MEKYFKTIEGKLLNIVEHTLEQIEKWPNLKIYIATDSQDQGDKSRFATTIVYRYGTRGAHYVVFKQEVPRIRVMYNRLFEEAVRTIDAATLITQEIPVKIEALEFDYSQIPKYKSNPLVSNIGGWAIGLGYNVVFKSGQMIASKAADHECRNNSHIFHESDIEKAA